MLFFVYHANVKCIVACSGGPDSMALLDMLRKENKDIAVAHVNYQKRDTAFRDEMIVRNYCEKYSIPFRILKPIYDHSYNFQAWARDVRYAFFESVCDEFDTKDIYVAHQMDDHIETYLFQKQRGMLCDWYGLMDGLNRKGYIVHRPCLIYTKSELEEYCIGMHVPYGIDESNLTDDYTRNQIRHSKIDKMTKKEKEQLFQIIALENIKNEEQKKEIEQFFLDWTIDSLLEKEKNWLYLDYYLNQIIGHHFSKKYCMDLCIKLKKDILIEIDGYDLERFHNQLYCVKQRKKVHDILSSIIFKEYEGYALVSNGKTIEGITLKNEDFPICIRTVENNDCIQLRFGKKNIHRFFVDRKIPKHIRKYWLVVENKTKEIIFVPEIGCDTEHFSVNPSVFMVQ